jgi:hypothetical protein
LTDPDRELFVPNRRFERAIAFAQVLATLAAVAATVVAVVVSARLVTIQKHSDTREAARAIREAYAVRFRLLDRGVEDMLKCKEKLPQYATGTGTRLVFADLKQLGAAPLRTDQLEAIQRASDKLNQLFYPGYSAPPSGTEAAYRAWYHGRVKLRAIIANTYMHEALSALGTRELEPEKCAGRERNAHRHSAIPSG